MGSVVDVIASPTRLGGERREEERREGAREVLRMNGQKIAEIKQKMNEERKKENR